jgi:hypothetical protein
MVAVSARTRSTGSAGEADAVAAIDGDDGACHRAGEVGGEERDDRRDLGGLGHPPERVLGEDDPLGGGRVGLLCKPLLDKVGTGEAGSDSVDADVRRSVVEREAAGQPLQPGFGGGLGEHPRGS